jgi:hypothetical protein
MNTKNIRNMVLSAIALTFLALGLLLIQNKNHTLFFSESNGKVELKGTVIETKNSLPRLFIQAPLELNSNAKYTYSVFGDSLTNREFVRIDKQVIQTGTVWFDNVSAFYGYDVQTGQYKRLLVSSEEQNRARFPQTLIVNPDNLTIKFFYDVSRPDSCYAYDCRAYWADFYRWDSKTSQFVQVNDEYKEFYQELARQYESFNKKGCAFGDVFDKGRRSLEEVYQRSSTNHCMESTRSELDAFMKYKNKL